MIFTISISLFIIAVIIDVIGATIILKSKKIQEARETNGFIGNTNFDFWVILTITLLPFIGAYWFITIPLLIVCGILYFIGSWIAKTIDEIDIVRK